LNTIIPSLARARTHTILLLRRGEDIVNSPLQFPNSAPDAVSYNETTLGVLAAYNAGDDIQRTLRGEHGPCALF
jgi:hypothetical protein